jgi:tetratricopeptide (TPR) repeat protein
MEPNLNEHTPDNSEPANKCIKCRSEDILHGYPNALCAECRVGYIKFPFPLWIKVFGIGIGVVVLFSCFSFFDNVQTGIHMERGIRAEKERLYFTAQKEFEKVLKKVPDHIDAKAHLLISAYYNQDFSTLIETSNSLEGETIEDQDLFRNAEKAINSAAGFFPSDSLNAVYERFKNDTGKVSSAIEDYYRNAPHDISAGLDIASKAFDKEDYIKADTILGKILKSDSENISALTLMSSIKRYQKDAPGALKYIDQLLSINKENLYALSSKARVKLMMHKDDEALQLAEQVNKLDKAFPYNIATLAIIYHYTNKVNKRDEIVKKVQASKDSATMEYMQYAMDIINNKEKLRD